MPDTEVGIGLNSPASLVPGLRSKVSLWLGPPSIHRRMQALCLTPDAAARAARTLSQPDIAAPPTPAADSFRKSRRDRPLRGFQEVMGNDPFMRSVAVSPRVAYERSPWGRGETRVIRLMIQHKFTAVEQHPQ